MTEKLIKLTADERLALEKLYRKSTLNAFLGISGFALALLLISIIPIGILNIFSSGDGYKGDDPSQSIIQDLGFIPWLIITLILFAVISFAIISGTRIFKLKKDLRDGEKLEVDVEVVSKAADTETDNYSMLVSGGSLKKQGIKINREQFNQYTKGQKITIKVYKNSRMMVVEA